MTGNPTETESVLEQYGNSDRLNARIEIHKRFSTNPYGWWRWVFDRFTFSPASRILELGAGPGDLWLENLSLIPPSWQILLSDFSAGMIQTAAYRLSRQPQFIGFQVVDAQAIPFPDKSCDVVIANHMLYHVPDRQKAMAEISRVLKPGGRFLATTVSLTHMQEVFQLSDTFLDGLGKAARKYFNTPGFCLENGAELLKPWFNLVACDVYKDSLEVTSAELLTQYVLSISPPGFPFPKNEDVKALKTHIQNTITQKGFYHILKMSGIFTAQK
jgi:ubiquinone/menaquinone biosynthesis C-methylase UbiE